MKPEQYALTFADKIEIIGNLEGCSKEFKLQNQAIPI